MPTPEEIRDESTRRNLATIGLTLSICGAVLWPLGFVGAYIGNRANRGGKVGAGEAAVVVGLITGIVGMLCVGSLFLRWVLGV